MSPWDMLKAGQYQEAADAYTVALKAQESPPNFCNRAIAYLNLGHLDKAMIDFKAAEKSRPTNTARGDAYGQWIGTVHWLGGEEQKAAQVWLDLVEGLESDVIGYTDAAGGVECGALLWCAATWLDDADLLSRARRWLAQFVITPKSVWPGPIAQLILGRIPAAEILLLTSRVPFLHERQSCQAFFYEAVANRAMSNKPATEVALNKSAVLSQAKLEQEYYLANHELVRLRSSASGL